MKIEVKVITFLILISMLLSACTVNTNTNKEADTEEDVYEDKYEVIDKGPVKGGSVKLFTTPIDTLNPILTNNMYVQDFLGLIFEGLYKLDNTGQPVPVLAKSTLLSTDGLTLTIYLKDNVKWHDKMAFKPEDVVFTINTIMDAKNNSIYLKNVKNIESVTAGSNNSVIIKLKTQYSFIKNELTFPIIPMHHFVDEKVNDKTSQMNLTPLGTGPYSFVSYDSQSIKLKQNEDWWNAKAEKSNSSLNVSGSDILAPYIPTVEIKIIKDLTTALNTFQTKEIDAIPANYNEFRKFIGRKDITLKRYTGRNYEFLSLNIKRGALADKRVRNAINLMINKKQLIDYSALGIAVAAEIPVMPSSWVYQIAKFDKANDLVKAKDLLSQSGYVLNSNNRYVRKTTQKQLTLKLIVNDDNSLRNSVAKEIASQLDKNGISVEVSKIPWDNVNKTIKSGSYDMAIMGYRISSIPDLSFAYSTNEIKSGLNVAGYSNPEVDNLLNKILIDSNIDNQKADYQNLFKIISDDRPYIGLFFLNEAVMYNKHIRGAINPYAWNKYDDVAKWYIP